MWRNSKMWTCLLIAGTVIVWLATEVVDAQNEARAAGPRAAQNGDEADPDLAALRKEVEGLRAEVKELRERVTNLETLRATRLLEFPVAPDRGGVPQTIPAPEFRGRRPQGEINGVPYYVIPVEEK